MQAHHVGSQVMRPQMHEVDDPLLLSGEAADVVRDDAQARGPGPSCKGGKLGGHAWLVAALAAVACVDAAVAGAEGVWGPGPTVLSHGGDAVDVAWALATALVLHGAVARDGEAVELEGGTGG